MFTNICLCDKLNIEKKFFKFNSFTNQYYTCYNFFGDYMEYDINKLIKEINFEKNMHKSINNMLLTENQMDVLNRYNIDYNKCSSMNELLYYIDECLNEIDAEDLEKVSLEIAETNYYMNTNK